MRPHAWLVVLALIVGACGGGATTTEKTTPATPQVIVVTATPAPASATPNVQATIEAAVKATVAALPAAPAAPAGSPQATAAPKPDAPAAGAPKVEATQVIHWKNSIGGIVVEGIVENQSTADAGTVQVAVSLIGDDGKTVGSGEAFQKPSSLKAGMKGPWQATISNVPAFKEVKVQVQARPPDSVSRAFSYQEFKADGVTVTQAGPPLNAPKISGQVINTGQKVASSVSILAAVFSADGKLMTVEATVAKLNEIAPGQSAPFEVNFLGAEPLKGKQIEKYELFIQGLPKN